jgi:hypothetical protein
MLLPGCPERDHIVADEPSLASRRRHGRAARGAVNADHILPCRHKHIVGSRAGMSAVAHGRPSCAILPRHAYAFVHRPVAHDESKTPISVNRCGCWAAQGYLDLWRTVDGAVLNSLYIGPVQVDHPVGIDSSQIGIHEYLGRQVRIAEHPTLWKANDTNRSSLCAVTLLGA